MEGGEVWDLGGGEAGWGWGGGGGVSDWGGLDWGWGDVTVGVFLLGFLGCAFGGDLMILCCDQWCLFQLDFPSRVCIHEFL